jgi:Polyketide cyclase / dehydrase and lipid transport
MATIRKSAVFALPASKAWSAFREWGAVHERLARGFVTDTKVQADGARIVSFANGFTAREVLVTMDDDARRLVYSAAGEQLSHHNGVFEVAEDGPDRCRIDWTADLLPEEMAPVVGRMMEDGMAAMKRTLEG